MNEENMRIKRIEKSDLTDAFCSNASALAAAAFERNNDREMRVDTAQHLHDADDIQGVYNDRNTLIGLAMYKARLWRRST